MYCDLVIRNVAQVVGDNVRKRRTDADITLDTLAAASPLPMSTGRIGNIEAARSANTLETLVAIAAALSRATVEPVTLADLLDGDGEVSLGGKFTVELSTLRAALRGQPVPIVDAGIDRLGAAMMDNVNRTMITRDDKWKRLPQWARRRLDERDWLRVYMTMRETDSRMCRNVGVDGELGAALMAKLWGRTFSDERDDRSEPGAKAQRKGQISRQLKAELLSAIKAGR